MPQRTLTAHLDRLSPEQYLVMTGLKNGVDARDCLRAVEVTPAAFQRWLARDRDFRAVLFHWRSIMAERAALRPGPCTDVCPYEPKLPDAIVLSWYRPEDWPRLRVALADGPSLPERYEDWLAIVTHIADVESECGFPVEKVLVDLEDLSAWCRRHACPMNAPARVLYTAERLTARGPRIRRLDTLAS
jgi:hypothetical protein